jgi:hypothetical protein
MNANRVLPRIAMGLCLGVAASIAMAEAGLNASSQTKVNNAKAKAWSSGSIKTDPNMQKSQVNIGSKRGGGCSDVNVGTAQAGQKAPKEIVVATKEVINICK